MNFPPALCELLCGWGAAPLGLGCRGAAPQTDILRHPNRREVHRALEAMTPTSRASHSSVMFSQLHVAGILSFQPRTGTASFTSPVERIYQQTKGPAHTYGVEQFPLMPAYSTDYNAQGEPSQGKQSWTCTFPPGYVQSPLPYLCDVRRAISSNNIYMLNQSASSAQRLLRSFPQGIQSK